jgi:hypothetical protein
MWTFRLLERLTGGVVYDWSTRALEVMEGGSDVLEIRDPWELEEVEVEES